MSEPGEFLDRVAEEADKAHDEVEKKAKKESDNDLTEIKRLLWLVMGGLKSVDDKLDTLSEHLGEER